MTGEFELQDCSGGKISLGDRVRVLGGGYDDPGWNGQVVKVHLPEQLRNTRTPNEVVTTPPILKILFDDGSEDDFSGWPRIHWFGNFWVFDDLERL